MTRVIIDRLCVSYGGTPIIDGLSLAIPSGSFFTLLGPSGCGKTTLLRSLAGFLPSQDGKLLFGDKDVTKLPAHERDIGMVFQDYALFPDKTVFDNVAYGLRARKIAEADVSTKVGEYLERVGLSAFPNRRPAELSGGQRQRVALARALVIKPTLLLMDEPLSNLDAKLRVQVRETIAELQREAGITTVFVTHDQEEALALSDVIGLMKQGKLEQVGTPQDIYQRPASAYVADFIGGANTIPILLDEGVTSGERRTIKFSGQNLQVYVSEPLPPGKAILIVRPEDISLSRNSKFVAGCISGKVSARQYLGGETHYTITLHDSVRLAVKLNGSQHDSFNTSDRVTVLVDPGKGMLVSR
jgi:iron(III) transport system ATP-binding protein